jgi:phosphonate dehydrogenase
VSRSSSQTPRTDRPRIVIGHRPFDETFASLEPLAEVVAPSDGRTWSQARLRRELRLADGWLAFMPDSADDALLACCRRLRLIAGALKGSDNFDVAACTRRGIWISVVPDLLTVPTAELTIAMMIGLGRHLIEGDRRVRTGRFRGWRPKLYGISLAGARVGFVGMGVIGRAIAERLCAFGVEQRYCDPQRLAPALEGALKLSCETHLETLLGWGDYLVLAAPLTPRTLHLIDARALQRIRPGCLLVNPSRGSLVDEAAVLDALESGHLGGYAADVFEMEDWARANRPRAIASRLRRHPATLFTPHLGSAVTSVRRAIEQRAADNLIDALSGRVPRDAVNPQARHSA